MRRPIQQPELTSPSAAARRYEVSPIAASAGKTHMRDADLKAPIIEPNNDARRRLRDNASRPQRTDRNNRKIISTQTSHVRQSAKT
jgi:hypothetical protein